VPWEVSFDVEALIDNLGQEIGGKKKQVEVNQGELKNKRTETGQGGFRGRNSGGGFIFVSMETRLPRRLFVFISPKKKNRKLLPASCRGLCFLDAGWVWHHSY